MEESEHGAGEALRSKAQRLSSHTRQERERERARVRERARERELQMGGIKRRRARDLGEVDSGGGGSGWDEDGEIEEEDALEWGSDIKSDLFREDRELKGRRGGSSLGKGREGGDGHAREESEEEASSFGISGGWWGGAVGRGDEENVQRQMEALVLEPLNLGLLYKCLCDILRPGGEPHVGKVCLCLCVAHTQTHTHTPKPYLSKPSTRNWVAGANALCPFPGCLQKASSTQHRR